MLVGLTVQMIALVIGVSLGGLAGYFGGRIDFFISRFIDIMTAFPGLLFAIFLITLWGVVRWQIMFRHLLPNALTPLLVAVSFGIPAAIFGEAGLSFLGIGPQLTLILVVLIFSSWSLLNHPLTAWPRPPYPPWLLNGQPP